MNNTELRQFRIDVLTDENPEYSKMMKWFTDLWSELEVSFFNDIVVYHHKSSVNDWVFFYNGDNTKWASTRYKLVQNVLWCNIKLYGDRLFEEVGNFSASRVRELTLYMMTIFRETIQDEKLCHIPDIEMIGLTNELTVNLIMVNV